MANTKLSDLFNPQVVGNKIATDYGNKIVVSKFANVSTTLTGVAGDTITRNQYTYIGDANVLGELVADTPAKLSTQRVTKTIVKVSKQVVLSDEALLSGADDPMGEAIEQIAMSIAKKDDADAIAELMTTTQTATGTTLAKAIVAGLKVLGEKAMGYNVIIFASSSDYGDMVADHDNWIPASEISAKLVQQGVVGKYFSCNVVPTDSIETGSPLLMLEGALSKEMKKSFRAAIDDSIAWLESDAGKAMTESFSTIVNEMGAIFSGLSDLIQAELDIQTAQIEAKYDKEISYAEGNKSQEVALEKQKQAEVGKAKQEANRKMFAMQVIQAVAQTAMSAISAYSSAAAIPIVGFVMAPIAAAMAVAAGAIQIAAIKKQQQASEATGYAEGGFTPAGPKYKEVGVVHAGEWVASQRLLADPQARAMINTLDYAQRTNRMGVLSSSDVSRQITAPAVIAQASTDGRLEQTLSATAAAIASYRSTMDDLTSRLNEPFVTVNTVSGDKGIQKAQEEYDQLMRNKSPKSRR